MCARRRHASEQPAKPALSESQWQRSADEEAFSKATKMPGTATGELAKIFDF